MAAIPYMPLYIADYMADAAHLSTIEHGAYLLLLMTYWQRGEALPDDDRKLAKICRMGPREWTKAKPAICEFFQVGCNKWVHKRVELELANVRAKSLQKRKAGLARAEQMNSTRLANAQRSDTDTVVTLAKASDAEASPDKVFWDSAKAYLGKSKAGMIGKWCRDHGQAEVAKAITEAQIARAVDPVPYIERTLRNHKQRDEESVTHGFIA